MSTEFGRVAVLMGGESSERAVSLKSGQAVLDALLAQNVEAVAVDTAEQGWRVLLTEHFDRAFVALHGFGGEDGRMQGLLDQIGLPYTGSGVAASALAMDKWRSKELFAHNGIATPHAQLVEPGMNEAEARVVLAKLGPKVIVKPNTEGSTVGMQVVDTPENLLTAVDEACQYSQLVFAEHYIAGEEYTVALLQDKVLPSIRIAAASGFYDYEAKYEVNTTQYHCPSGLDDEAEQMLGFLAKRAFAVLGCEGWGRVDFMRDSSGEFYCLEVNTVPGLTATSLVPKAALAVGMDFKALVHELLATSL